MSWTEIGPATTASQGVSDFVADIGGANRSRPMGAWA